MFKSILIIVMLFASTSYFASDSKAIDSALEWLEVVDSGNYVESWERASPIFQSNNPSSLWNESMAEIHLPLGKLISRKVFRTNEISTIPNAPKGEYVSIVLASSFENMNDVMETAIVKKNKDKWSVVSYFLK